MIDNVAEYLFELTAAENVEAVWKAFDRIFDELDIEHRQFAQAMPDQEIHFRTTMPEWFSDFYNDGNFYDIDPIVRRSSQSLIPFHFDSDKVLQSRFNENFANLAQTLRDEAKYDIGHIVPLEIINGKCAAMLNVGGLQSAGNLSERLSELAPQITVAAHLTHRSLLRIRKDRIIGKLTARERDILRYRAQGMRAANVAYQMRITERAVAFHLANIRRKTGAATNEEAMAIVFMSDSEPLF